MVGYILSVLLQQGICVLSTGTVRRGDIVLFGFQPINDLSDGLVIRLFALGVKVGQYFVKALNTDLRIIDKSQYAPTNGWRLRDSPCPSAMLFMP